MTNNFKPNTVQPISEKVVRTTLDRLLYTSVDRGESPLQYLLLVDEFLANPDLPDTPHKREFAIHHILTSLIIEGLAHHREVQGFDPPNENCTIGAAKAEIKRDTRTNNQELIGWTWLYYHYVRVDLNISAETFSEIALFDPRTLRRYQQNTLRRLTNRLYQLEWEASKVQRQRRLATALPIMTRVALFGREAESTRLNHLINTLQPAHVQITGKSGIGKSTFAQEVIRDWIESNVLDYVVWITRPDSVASIQQTLAQSLNYEAINSTLRQYLNEKRAVIVIDDGDALRDDAQALTRLLDDLSSARVFLINQRRQLLRNVVGYVHLDRLSDEASKSFIRDYVARHFHGELGSISAGDIETIMADGLGHPTKILQTIHMLYHS